MAKVTHVSSPHVNATVVSESRFAPIQSSIRLRQFPGWSFENQYSYPYAYNQYPIYQQPSFYGTCSAVSGVGITSNNCVPNSTPVATAGNGCYCYDPYTQWAGCGNVANGVCRTPVAQPILYPSYNYAYNYPYGRPLLY